MDHVTHPRALTPVENRGGLWYKREDLFRADFGVNGSKLRVCFHLITKAMVDGARRVVSASVLDSPQSAMAAVVSRKLGLPCDVIVAGTTPELAVRRPSVRVAVDAGATVYGVPGPGYNTRLQHAGARHVAANPGSWLLPYGITTPADASDEDVEDFLRVGAPQVANLPDEVETLILPFGSANTACGVLYGLHDVRPAALRRIMLMEIGPSRRDWAEKRLNSTGRPMAPPGVELEYVTLHGVFSNYTDKMPETLDDIVMHPTYEGKIVRYLNQTQPDYWTRRDGTTAFWIVGGPI